MNTPIFYSALAMQTKCHTVNKCANRNEAYDKMKASIAKLSGEIFGAKKFIGDHLRLILLPEYFMTGFPVRESIGEWLEKACITKDDGIFEGIGNLCKTHNVFISGNYYEKDINFPNLYFQSCFNLNSEGQMILNYRRLNSMYSPTPHDVLDKYLELYGEDSLFPVVETELGNLACIASEEILYPEVARCLMMRGAEVFLHSSSEIGSPALTKKNIAKQARAIENMAYLISANTAGVADIGILVNSADGGSKIINYEGLILAESYTGESIVATAAIHIPALRAHRETVSMKNYNARQRFELYASSYQKYSHYPANSFLGKEKIDKQEFKDIQKETIKRLFSKK